MQASTINCRTIKISFNKETHIYRGPLEINDVHNYIDTAFNKKKIPADFKLMYTDEDGDNITVSCNEDLDAFVETQTSRKMQIVANTHSDSSEDEAKNKQPEQKQENEQEQSQEQNQQQQFANGFEKMMHGFKQWGQQNQGQCGGGWGNWGNEGKWAKKGGKGCWGGEKGKWAKKGGKWSCDDKQKEEWKKMMAPLKEMWQQNMTEEQKEQCKNMKEMWKQNCQQYQQESQEQNEEKSQQKDEQSEQTEQKFEQKEEKSEQKEEKSQQKEEKSEQKEEKSEQKENVIVFEELLKKQEEEQTKKVEEVQQKPEEKVEEQPNQKAGPKQLPLKKVYGPVTKAKAGKVTEVLGGHCVDYYGVCEEYSKDTVDYIVEQLLESPDLVTVFSSYQQQ